jgi:SAM-dependent methyltransferase
MKWFRENFFKNIDPNKTITVLDVGSQCIPGQSNTYKVFFNEKQFNYIGLDMAEGYNVDIILKKPYQWDEISDDFCDALICGQVFEHIEFPWFTISEIARVVKPDGLICIIVPSMAVLHRYPVNTCNYFSDGMIALAKYAGLEVLHVSTNYAPKNATPSWYSELEDTILVARKPENWKANSFDKENYICEPADLEKMATGLVPVKEQSYYKKYKFKEYIKIILRPRFGIRMILRKLLK